MLANTPAMLEAHYGVPMTGAVLNTLNTRLDAPIIAFTLDHAETKILITDREFSKIIKEALTLAKAKPLVIDYDDPEFTGPGERLGSSEYEAFLAGGEEDFAWSMPADEWDAISLNYTSGTTGDPKGVVYHHRGAYLLALGNVVTCGMAKHPVYLWTLPMFHCNGWCFPWSVSVTAGTHVCLRQVRATAIYDLIVAHKVTHLCGAPIVMSTILGAPEAEKKPLQHRVEFFTAASAPPETALARSRRGRGPGSSSAAKSASEWWRRASSTSRPPSPRGRWPRRGTSGGSRPVAAARSAGGAQPCAPRNTPTARRRPYSGRAL